MDESLVTACVAVVSSSEVVYGETRDDCFVFFTYSG